MKHATITLKDGFDAAIDRITGALTDKGGPRHHQN